MKVLVSNPNIAPHIRETLKGLNQAKALETFFTSYYYNSSGFIESTVGKIGTLNKELKRREISNITPQLLRSRSFPELLRVFSSRFLTPKITDTIWEWAELGFDKWVASQIAYTDANIVMTAEHAGLETIKAANVLGKITVHEQPSQHYAFFNAILKRQFSAYPELNAGAGSLLMNNDALRRNDRRDAELHSAKYILCNSNFTKRTLTEAGFSEEKIITVPLGAPVDSSLKRNGGYNKSKTVFMYAGNFTLRKGTHLLLQAWRELSPSNAELWLYGKNFLPNEFYNNLPPSIIINGNIPNKELMEIYPKADVFILPSLADGFGMVVTEAMSKGLPVIATYNCGTADFISHKKNGYLMDAESIDEIKDAIEWFMDHKKDIPDMGEAASRAISEYSWPNYHRNLAEALNKLIND